MSTNLSTEEAIKFRHLNFGGTVRKIDSRLPKLNFYFLFNKNIMGTVLEII